MSIADKLKEWFSSEEYDDEYEPIMDESETDDDVEEKRSRGVTLNTTAKFQMVLSRPTSLSDLKSIGAELNEQKVVILNLELVSKEIGQRFLDYLQGVAFANNASFKKTAQDTFVFMPKNVEFSGIDLMSELEAGGYGFN